MENNWGEDFHYGGNPPQLRQRLGIFRNRVILIEIMANISDHFLDYLGLLHDLIKLVLDEFWVVFLAWNKLGKHCEITHWPFDVMSNN